MVVKKSRLKINCNLCGSPKQQVIYSSSPYPIVSCLNCHLCFLSPRPKQTDITQLYTSQYFNQSQPSAGYTSYDLLKTDLIKEAQQRITLIKQYVRRGRLLDVGCAYGTFLAQAKKANFKVFGCDINKNAVVYVRQQLKIEACFGDIAIGKLPKGLFDVITAWDVIEHLVDPKKSLFALYKIQKPGGFLFMTTPNIDSLDAKIMGTKWYGYKRIPEHLFYFSPRSISELLQSVGYDTIAVKSWGFQRNLAYCVQQIARYNAFIGRCLQPIIRFLPLEKISLFFPIIDMMIIAQKPK